MDFANIFSSVRIHGSDDTVEISQSSNSVQTESHSHYSHGSVTHVMPQHEAKNMVEAIIDEILGDIQNESDLEDAEVDQLALPEDIQSPRFLAH